MDQLLFMMRLLREIHQQHLATIGGYRFDLILANDCAYLALLNGYEEAVWEYANLARSTYDLLEIPENVVLAGDLTTLVTTPNWSVEAA